MSSLRKTVASVAEPPTGDDVQVTTFSLTSSTGGTNLPYTIGHAFREGDVPSGRFIKVSSAQADVQNVWPDGSAKIALISGVATLSAGVPLTIDVMQSATSSGGGALTLAQLRAAVASGSLVFSSGVTATVNIATVLAGAPHRTRCAGPQMIEAHWRAPVGSDAHLVAWFYVRYYAGGAVEIETVVENGYLNVAAPGRKTYTATLTIGGTQRYTGAITHEHHTRWSRSDWYGTDPAITPAHNLAYLKSTKLVPNVPAATPTAAAWTTSDNWNTLGGPATVANSGAPFARGNYRQAPSSGGDAPSIGIIPAWEALYLSSGDARAYTATIVNARCFGRYPLCYRDESTVRGVQHAPVQATQYPLLAFGANAGWNYGWGGGTTTTPAATESPPSEQLIDLEHQPSAGYLAYLLTGRWPFIESCQFAASASVLSLGTTLRAGATCRIPSYEISDGPDSRATAWSLRQVAWAAAITPDSSATLQGEFRAIFDNNISYRYGLVTSGATANNLGLIAFDFEDRIGGYSICKPWMQSFLITVLGQAYDLQVNASAGTRATHQSLLTEAYKFTVGLHGTTGGFNYRRAGMYRLPYASGGSGNGPRFGATFLSSWSAVYSATLAVMNPYPTSPNTFAAISFADGLSLSNMVHTSFGSPPAEIPITGAGQLPPSYSAQVAVPLAYAVDHGAGGAQAAYDRFVGSSSFTGFSGEFADRPKIRIAPRAVTSDSTTLAAQAAALSANSWSANIAPASLNTADGQGCTPLTALKAGQGPTVYIDWGGKAAWDSVSRQFLTLGAPAGTGSDPGATALGRYSQATNTWTRTPNPLGVATGHVYDNYDIDSAGRRLFKLSFQQNQSTVYVYNLDSAAVTSLGVSGTSFAVPGLAWFPTLGAQGSLIVCGNNLIRRYDFASAAWSTVQAAVTGEAAFAHYNPYSDTVVCGGGNSATARVYRVSNTGAVTDHGVPPVRLGADFGGHAIVVPHPSSNATLAFCADASIRSMTLGGTWSTVGTIATAARSQDYPSVASFNSVAASIPALGVVMFASYYATGGVGRQFLYRP